MELARNDLDITNTCPKGHHQQYSSHVSSRCSLVNAYTQCHIIKRDNTSCNSTPHSSYQDSSSNKSHKVTTRQFTYCRWRLFIYRFFDY